MKNIISQYRKEIGISQVRLAEILGVSRQTIISIEKGKYKPSLPLAMNIANLFETNVENLFFLEEQDRR